MFGQPTYGITRTVSHDFDTAVERIRATLADNGFGVLTEIDFSGTIKKKLGHDMGRYVILGACHPASAWAAYQAATPIGLLLPCNVVVAQDGNQVVVSAIDPEAMFTVVDAVGMDSVVDDVRQRLTAAIEAV
jgi:uncharacterized protein (DUF302 family)